MSIDTARMSARSAYASTDLRRAPRRLLRAHPDVFEHVDRRRPRLGADGETAHISTGVKHGTLRDAATESPSPTTPSSTTAASAAIERNSNLSSGGSATGAFGSRWI